MRIGELAEQAGVSTRAIRYYEQAGILAPPERTRRATVITIRPRLHGWASFGRPRRSASPWERSAR
jgi:hypothetical protein